MASILADQGGVVAVMSAEGGIFDIMAGRYSNGIPNLDVWLKGHSGDQLRVDRKNRPTEVIDRPCITNVLTVQPEVLHALSDKPGFRGRGLIARFLYSMPASTVGRRTIAPPPVPTDVQRTYERNVSALLRTTEALDKQRVVNFSPAAHSSLVRFEALNEPRLDAITGALCDVVDWGSKLVGAVARIAGLLHVAQYPESWLVRAVEEHTVDAAVIVGEYFTSHMVAVADLMRVDKEVEEARRIIKWISARTLRTFSQRDVHHDLQHAFPRAIDLEAPLTILVERGYLRAIERSHRGMGRPPSQRYAVNPWLAGTWTTAADPSTLPGAEPTEHTDLQRIPTSVRSVGVSSRSLVEVPPVRSAVTTPNASGTWHPDDW